MELKKVKKINLLLAFLALIIIIMSAFIYKLYNEKIMANEKLANSEQKVNSLTEKVSDLQEKSNSIQMNKLNVDTAEINCDYHNVTYVIQGETVTYEINVKDEIYAIIKALSDKKVISKEVEMSGVIDKIGSINIENIGDMILISDAGGEYCGISIYQLLNNDIKFLGNIYCGADTVDEANYTINLKDEKNCVIVAEKNNRIITKDVETVGKIIDTSIIDLLNYGKFVLISQIVNDNYEIQAYRLGQNYVTGELENIISVGSIQTSVNVKK